MIKKTENTCTACVKRSGDAWTRVCSGSAERARGNGQKGSWRRLQFGELLRRENPLSGACGSGHTCSLRHVAWARGLASWTSSCSCGRGGGCNGSVVPSPSRSRLWVGGWVVDSRAGAWTRTPHIPSAETSCCGPGSVLSIPGPQPSLCLRTPQRPVPTSLLVLS